MNTPQSRENAVQLDIVSDVMCPWCVIGYKQLEQALAETGLTADLHWHPFELNPMMPDGGQNLAEHLSEKYGSTPAQSRENRVRLQNLGADLGFDFNFTDQTRIVNTFLAHQLLDWAGHHGKQHALKLALLRAYFTDALDVSSATVLVQIADTIGLNAAEAAAVLTSGEHAQPVRKKQEFWTSRGISGVPSIVFGGKYLLTGAQGTQTYADILRKTHEEFAAA